MPEVEGGEARQALESEHAALGALLFIAAVESAFQLHQQCALASALARGVVQRTPLAFHLHKRSGVVEQCNSCGLASPPGLQH